MSKLPNKAKGEVALPPEAGDDAYLLFDIDTMERFHGELGDEYLSHLPRMIVNLTPPKFLRTAVETMMVNGDIEKFPFGLTIDEIKTLALDAISRGMNGKDFADAAKEAADAEEKRREDRIKKKLDLMTELTGTSQIAAVLADPEILSMLRMNALEEQVSVSANSENTPSTTSSDMPSESSKAD